MFRSTVITTLIFVSLFILSDNNHSQLFSESEYIVIEDFNKSTESFFKEWKNLDSSNNPRKIYNISHENGKNFLHASTENNPSLSIQIGKQISHYWNIKNYPVLSWEWRVHSIPEGATEMTSKRNDSAASIYVLFPRKKVPLIETSYQPMNWLKYVWSSTQPVGSWRSRNKDKSGIILYDGRYIVLASGHQDKGKWISFRRNIPEDYKKYFGEYPSSNPLLIAILTDSDSTDTKASADYANITAWKY